MSLHHTHKINFGETMMKPYLLLLQYVLLSTLCYAGNNDSSAVAAPMDGSRTIPIRLSLVIDPDITMRSGVEDILTLHYGITHAEDRLLGIHWFPESNIIGKMGGIVLRYFKYDLIDLPLDYYSVVLGHEYFGHGARYRELNMGDIHYGFDWPPPYGKGGGEATNSKSVFISSHEELAIWMGGLESQSVMSRIVSLRWMAARTINYREAFQYFWTNQISWKYIQTTTENLNDGIHDSDPRAYVRLINALNGYTDVTRLKMSVKNFKSKMLINAANPFVFFSFYTMIKTYLWDGKVSNSMPTIHLGNVDYLPSLRAGLTPFGIEYHVDNYVRYKRTVSLIDLHYGDQIFDKSWGGIGIHVSNIYSSIDYSVDINVDVWKQPEMLFGLDPTISKGGGIGGAVSVREYYNIPNSWLSAVFELGYKSVGFLEGLPLDSSLIAMIGLAIRK